MNKIEFKTFLEERGYKVRNIRTFKNSFHVNYKTPDCRIVAYHKIPLSSIPSKFDGGYLWIELFKRYPPIMKREGTP